MRQHALKPFQQTHCQNMIIANSFPLVQKMTRFKSELSHGEQVSKYGTDILCTKRGPLWDGMFFQPSHESQNSDESLWERVLAKCIWERPYTNRLGQWSHETGEPIQVLHCTTVLLYRNHKPHTLALNLIKHNTWGMWLLYNCTNMLYVRYVVIECGNSCTECSQNWRFIWQRYV